jgi:hypothetical protein
LKGRNLTARSFTHNILGKSFTIRFFELVTITFYSCSTFLFPKNLFRYNFLSKIFINHFLKAFFLLLRIKDFFHAFKYFSFFRCFIFPTEFYFIIMY